MKRSALLSIPLLCVTFAVTPAQADSGGGLGIAPLSHSSTGPGAGYFIENTQQGATVHEALVIANGTGHVVSLKVYPVDGLTGVTSGAVFANKEDPRHKDGLWVTVATDLTVPNGQRVTVPFTVVVPPDAVPGDHLAGIDVEPADGGTVTKSGLLGVRVLTRNVVGVLLHVAGPAVTLIKVESVGLQKLSGFGTASVTVRIANVGQKLAKPKLSLTLVSDRGYTKTLSRQLDTVLPRDTIDYPFSWPEALPAGHYRIHAELSAAGMATSVLDGTAALDVALLASTPGIHPVVASVRHSGWLSAGHLRLLAGLGALLALILLAVFGFLRTKRTPGRRRKGSRGGDGGGGAAGGKHARGHRAIPQQRTTDSRYATSVGVHRGV